jgi:hypothetical protein
MSNPSEPHDAGTQGRTDDQTEQMRVDPESEPVTEIIGSASAMTEAVQQQEERRFTAPSGFDGSTQKITPPPDPETEVFAPPTAKAAAPQMIPPRDGTPPPPAPETPSRRSWGWVIAVLLVIAALVAIAILGTVLLTRHSTASSSQEDKVRVTIENFDAAIQRGDLATLRSITCGSTRDNYVNYDQRAWDDTHARVAAAKQYPVVSSIDQVVIHDDHAEANVTTFMAFAPQTRSTRSFDLQFRDDQWKICQAPAG